MIERRVKEIGIRKVIGASISNIITLIITEFLKWILIANLIAWPIAWYILNYWLQNFAYRISIHWWIFGIAGSLTMMIALLTVSWQAIRAATANPINSLRYE
jgi:putative ABC transport system permease protein